MAISFDAYTFQRNPLYNWERELQRGIPQTNPYGCARHLSESRSREEHYYLLNMNNPCYAQKDAANSLKEVVAKEAPKKQSNKLLLLLEN